MPGWRHPDLRFLCSDSPLDPLLVPQYGCSLELKSEEASAMVEGGLSRVFAHRISSQVPSGHVTSAGAQCLARLSGAPLQVPLHGYPGDQPLGPRT